MFSAQGGRLPLSVDQPDANLARFVDCLRHIRNDDRRRLVLVGGAAVECHVNGTGCRRGIREIDVGIAENANPFWQADRRHRQTPLPAAPSSRRWKQEAAYQANGFPFYTAVRAVVAGAFGEDLTRVEYQRSSWVKSLHAFVPPDGKLMIDFLGQELLLTGAFLPDLAPIETLSARPPHGSAVSADFPVQHPVVVALSKMREGRISSLVETPETTVGPEGVRTSAPDLGKATQDILDIAMIFHHVAPERIRAGLAGVVVHGGYRLPGRTSFARQQQMLAEELRRFAELAETVAFERGRDLLAAHCLARGGTPGDVERLPELGQVAQQVTTLVAEVENFRPSKTRILPESGGRFM